jgi:hypothetical protein
MTVTRLRQIAGQREGFTMTPREIKFSREKDLINKMKTYYQKRKNTSEDR